MSKPVKRICAVFLTLVTLFIGVAVVNVFAEEPIPMPSYAERGYGRSMYAIYQMWSKGEITDEQFEACLPPDAASSMYYGQVSDSSSNNYSFTMPKGNSGMEGLTFERLKDYAWTEMWWYFRPLTSDDYGTFTRSYNESSNNFYFLFSTYITDYDSYAKVTSIHPGMDIWSPAQDPVSDHHYYKLMKNWNTYYGHGISWKIKVTHQIAMRDFSCYIFDHSIPGSSGWIATLKETGDLNETIYQLKLTPKNSDKLRAVNQNITARDLESLQLNVTMHSSNGSIYVIPAKAVDLDTEGIYYDFYGDEWAEVWQEDLTITSIQVNNTVGSYDIYDPYIKKNITDLVGLKTELPVSDLAGNGIRLDNTTKIEFSGLTMDRNSPVITEMDFTPSTAYSGGSATEASYADSFLGGKVYSYWYGGERFHSFNLYTIYSPSLAFDEEVFVEEEDRDKVYAVLNIYDENGKPVTTKLDDVRWGRLIFDDVDILPGYYSVSGDNVKIVDLVGAEYVRDRLGNYNVQNVEDLNGKKLPAPCIIYVDGYAPEVTVGDAVIRWKDSNGSYYDDVGKIQDQITAVALTVPIQVVDQKTVTVDGQTIDIAAAGSATTTGYVALENPYADMSLRYLFTVTQSQEFPDVNSDQYTWKKGTVSSGGNSQYVAFVVGQEDQKSYLHLELTGLDDYEFTDDKGLTLQLYVQDQCQNDVTLFEDFQGIHVDNRAPVITSYKNRTYPRDGKATLSADFVANDTNGVRSVWCCWSDSAENDGLVFNEVTNGKASLEVEGSGVLTKYLHIRAVDTYGNYANKVEAFTVNLTTAVSQYTVSGDLTRPTADPTVTVSAPLTSSGAAVDVAGAPVTRVIFDIYRNNAGIWGHDIYFRYYDSSAENEDPFTYGDGVEWYYLRANVSNLDLRDLEYSAAAKVEGTPGWASYYGNIDLYIASTITGFTEENGYYGYGDDGSSYSDEKIGTVAYSPNVADLYAASYVTGGTANAVYDAWGNEVEVIDSELDATGGLDYCIYRVDKDMTGLRFDMDLVNTAISNWGIESIDFEKSYAVLVSVNEDGTIMMVDGQYAEVSARMPLERSLQQTLVVPGVTKDGNAYSTGCYSWVVCVAQKAGAVQYFDDCFWYILLDDASPATEDFGIREQHSSIEVTWGGTTIDHVTKAEKGVLDSINIGIAEVSELGYNRADDADDPAVEKHEIDGFYAYSTATISGLANSRNTNPSASFTITAAVDQNVDYGAWMGHTLGAIEGIRFWNKASTGAGSASWISEQHPYSNNGVTGTFAFDETTGIGSLTVTFFCGTSAEQLTNIVTPEELAAKTPGVFAVTTGSNTICYQLIMENGSESPVYQFDMNLVGEAPQVNVEFEYGPSYAELRTYVDDNWNYFFKEVKIAEYIDVSFTDIISGYTDLNVYYVSYNYVDKDGHIVAADADDYSVYKLTAEELANGFRITNGSANFVGNEGYYYAGEGYRGTRTAYTWPGYYNYGTDAFFVVTDASGNATAVYPIDEGEAGHEMNRLDLGSDAGIDEDGSGYIWLGYDETSMGMVAQKLEVVMDRVYDADGNILADGHMLMNMVSTYDYEVVEEDGYEQIQHNGTSDTGYGPGIIGPAEWGGISFAWPYDASKAEGEPVTHTVEFIYHMGDHIKKETFTIEDVPNIKPVVTAKTGIGSVALTYNVPVHTTYNGISTTDYILMTDVSLYGTDYELSFMDLYGNTYTQTIHIDEMPGLTISYSTTDPTTEPVTVTVGYIAPLYLENGSGGQTTLQLTFTENGSRDIYDADGSLLGTVYVGNIFDTLEVDPYIFWDYSSNDISEGNVIYREVTAYLADRNGAAILDPATGDRAKFTFVPGGLTQYTFSGCCTDRGTPVADITAKLEVTLEIEPVDSDTQAPDVDIVSYVTFENKAYNAETVYRLDSGRFPETSLKDYLALYGMEAYYTDMDNMLESLGWAESYMFHFDVRDESKVKLILRADPYEDLSGIRYTTSSQNIDGVNLVGRTLEIKENMEFALYLVDEYNNVTPIYFRTTALGDEPVPNVEQVMALDEDGNYVVRAYLLPLRLTNVTELKITDSAALIDNNDYSTTVENPADVPEIYSQYEGLYYMVFDTNGTYPINYSYTYRGVENKGTVQVTVDMIDNTRAAVTKGSFSANYYAGATNQDVVWQAQLNVPVRAVSAVQKVGEDAYNAISGTTLQEYGVYITYMGDEITVIYEDSTTALEEAFGEIYLKLTAQSNSLVSYHAIPSVTGIDKKVPELTAKVSYSGNHKSATVTVTADETVISQNANRTGTEFTFTVLENTTKTYAVVDAAGNYSSIRVTVDGLVLDPLVITLMDAKGNVITDPARYEAQIGETLKVLTNRPADVWVFGEEARAKECDGVTPVELVVSENNMGLHPTFGAQDAYGNSGAVQLDYIMPRNVTAPVIVVHRLKVSVSCNATEEEIMEKLLANIIYSDDNTAYGDLKVNVEYDKRSTAAQRLVTYTVTDDAGNVSVAQCWLQIRSGLEPEIMVNGVEVQSDDILQLGNVDEVNIAVTFAGGLGEPYKLVYEGGNLQSWAKLKDGIYLTDTYSDAPEATFTLTDLEDGWYSFALFTQSMEIYYFQIYVGAVK